MVVWTLALSSIVSVLMGLFYILVGKAVMDPSAKQAERWARDAFAVWWFGFAGSTLLSGAGIGMAAFDLVDVHLQTSLLYLQWLFLSAGLAGLFYYLVYVYTGKTVLGYPVALFYLLFYITVVYAITAMSPDVLEVREWTVTVAFENELSSVLVTMLLVALVAPVILAAALYLLLYFKVDDPVQKTRVLLVGGAFLLWFGSSGVALFTPLSEWYYWPFTSRVLALAASLVILYAFTGLERRRGVAPVLTKEEKRPNSGSLEEPSTLDQAVVGPTDSAFLRS